MKKENIVNPIGLKGKDKMNHIIGLMAKMDNMNESVKPIPSVSISKSAPDGNVYAIIRENSEYFIKVAKQKDNLSIKDFKYIGGLQNQRELVFETYNKATKSLNNKLTSVFEAYGLKSNVDTFKSDKLVSEETAFSHGFSDDVEECNSVEESEDIEAQTANKDDEITGDNLTGGFGEKAGITSESVKHKMSIMDLMVGDKNIIPEGYEELMFKKVKKKD